MASCTITSTCSLAQEALQYVGNDENGKNFANMLTTLYRLPEFRNAVREAEKQGYKEAIMNYHKDGSPTYKSMIRFLGVVDKVVAQDSSILTETNPFDQYIKVVNPVALLDNKLAKIAEQKLGSNAFTTNSKDVAIEYLEYEDAIDIATTFNLLNAVGDKFIAVVRKEEGSKKFKIQIVNATNDNIKEMKESLPKYAAIDALVSFFEDLGLLVDFDLFNDILAGVEHTVYEELDENRSQISNAVLTVISICTNSNDNYVTELPLLISRNAAVMVAKILMKVAEENPEFRNSTGYLRLETAVQRYINTHPDDKVTIQALMEQLIASEVEARVNRNIIRGVKDSEKAKDKMLAYTKQRVKTFFTKVREFFKKKDDLIKKWKSKKFQDKDINIKELQRKASIAVTEMFELKSDIKTTINSREAALQPNRRQALKRYTNDELRRLKIRLSETLKLLVDIQNRYKKHMRFLLSKDYIKEATKFETIIDNLESTFNETNEVGSVASLRDVASLALSQTAIDMSEELKQINIDLTAIHEKIMAMVPDYADPEYMLNVSKLLSLYSRYELICGVMEDIKGAINNKLINSEVRRLGPSGVERSNIGEIIEKMNVPIALLKDGFNSNINKINVDLLILIIGNDTMDIVIGKLFNTKRNKKMLEDLAKLKGDGKYYQSRRVVEKILEDPGNVRNNLWQRWLGSVLNSASLLNQISYIAVNQANMEAHNNTLRTLYIITEGRRNFGRLLKAVIERDEKGMPTGNLIRPIDYTTYEKELQELELQWGREFTEKYKESDYTRDLLAILWKDFRQLQFNAWNKTGLTPDKKQALRYKKQKFTIKHPLTGKEIPIEMYAPNKEIYKNYSYSENDTNRGFENDQKITRWDNLSVEEKEASDWFFALKYFSDLKLDGLGSGAHVIPLFRGNTFDTFWGKFGDWGTNLTHIGTLAKNSLSRSLLEDMDDSDFGAMQPYTPYSNERYYTTEEEINDTVKRIPLYGVRKLKNMDGLSTDLYSSYLAYDDMSNNYNAKSKVEVLLTSVHTQSNGSLNNKDTNRLAEKTNWFQGRLVKEEFERFVDKEIYGIKKWDKSLSGIRIRLSKMLNHVGRFTTIVFLGGNFHSALVNLITGYNEIIKEAGVGEYINKTDIIKAMGTYMHHVQFKKVYLAPKALSKDAPRGFMPYFMRLPADSPGLVNLVLRDFDFTERFVTDIRNYTTNTFNKIGKLFINPMRLVMLPYEITDHWMLAVPLMAMLNHEKVYDRDGKEISLMNAMYGRNLKVEKPDYIDTGNRFGIFYKSEKDRKEGEDLLKMIQDIVSNINDFKTKPNHLPVLADEEGIRKYLKDEFKLPLPTTLREFEDVRKRLSNKFEKHIFNNAEMSKFLLKTREIVNRMHGVYDSRSKGAFDKKLCGALFLSMKNYAVGLVNRRLMIGHWNMVLNKWDEGSLITVTKVVANAFSSAWREAGFWNTIGTTFALISPYVGGKKRFLGKAMINSGFSESLIYNLKRAKLDVLRVWAFGVLRGIIQGLSQGWIGGFDDDDDEALFNKGELTLYEKMLHLDETAGLTKKSIESGKAFEEGEPLHSTVTLREVLVEIGYIEEGAGDEEIVNALLKLSDYPNGERDFIINVLMPHLDELYMGYKGEGSINATMGNLFTEWCNEDERTRYRYKKNKKTGEITREKGTGKKKRGKKIFPEAFEAKLAKILGDGSKLPDTPMLKIMEQAKGLKEYLNQLLYDYQAGHRVKKRRNYDPEDHGMFELPYFSIQTEIVKVQNQLTAIEHLKNSFNKYYASKKLTGDYLKLKEQFFAEYNVNSISELKERFMNNDYLPDDKQSTGEAMAQLKLFLDSYEKIEKKLDSSEKYLRNRKFEDAYFETEHPNLKYWMGVLTYFTERSLIELESFIPFADLTARKGGTLTANLTAQGVNWTGLFIGKMFGKVMPKIFNYTPVEEEPWHFNALNELSNLFSLPAASASITASSEIFAEGWDAIFSPSEEEYNKKVENLRRLIEFTTDDATRDELLQLLYELQSDWNKHHVLNNSAKLKKGEHKFMKYKSFTPYLRTLHMLGFFNYLDGSSVLGGYQAAEAFKSFYYKEDRYRK